MFRSVYMLGGLAVALLVTTKLIGATTNDGGQRYRAYLGKSEVGRVYTQLSQQYDLYRVERTTKPVGTIAHIIGDEVSEISLFNAGEAYFRTYEYRYAKDGKAEVMATVGEDNIVRMSNGKEFKLADDDIVIDMGSLQHLFRFLPPNKLVGKNVKVVTHKRIDTYRFGNAHNTKISVPGESEPVDVLLIRADDINKPGRYSEFWLDPRREMLMVKMHQQSEKKRPMLPNSMTLELELE